MAWQVQSLKNLSKKWRSYYKIAYQYNDNKALSKRALIGTAVFDALSNKKKCLTLYRVIADFRWRCVVQPPFWEKMKKIFGFFKKPLVFRIGVVKSLENFSEKRRYRRKVFIVYERANDGLSPHVFISILTILPKTNFFEEGASLNCFH